MNKLFSVYWVVIFGILLIAFLKSDLAILLINIIGFGIGLFVILLSIVYHFISHK